MSTFKQARAELKTIIEGITALSGVEVFLERSGTDIDAAVEAALNTKGVAIVIMESDGAVVDQVAGARACAANVTVPISLLDNLVVNHSGTDGLRLDSETAIYELVCGVIGKEVADGNVTLSSEIYARLEEGSGLIEHYVGLNVPVLLQSTG